MSMVPATTPLEVIHRDERILAINKPVGLLSVPGIITRPTASFDNFQVRLWGRPKCIWIR
jgi:23S rRNA-/tRNA-specific pseudouridylate synthase